MAGGEMRRLLVVGTGQMGPGIALSAARQDRTASRIEGRSLPSWNSANRIALRAAGCLTLRRRDPGANAYAG